MTEKRLAAGVFIPNEDDGRDLDSLARAAGLQERYEPQLDEGGLEVLYGRWAAIDGTRVTVERLDLHTSVQLYFWLSEFFAGLGHRTPRDDLPLEQDPVAPRAGVFLAACERLGAEVGILVTHLDQANPDWIRAQYHHVLGMNGAALVTQRYGLLYMHERVARDVPDDGRLDDRDVLRGEHGLLVFAGRGATRWF